jgi:hypothetical protein
MEKSARKPLYKPQVDSVDINVNVYTNEVCDNTTCGNTNCPSGCETNNGCNPNTTFLCW